VSHPVDPVQRLPHQPPAIVAATDLGGVCVLKHARQFLLTDPNGDVHLDSRGLGLYDGDTRVLSCLELRVNGLRPSLLRTDGGGAASGTIQLTNRELRQHPSTGDGGATSLAGRSLAVTRHHRLQDGLHERLVIANYTELARTVVVELLLDADMADIFEVPGHVRPRRGDHGPIEVQGARATFADRGLDNEARRTRVTADGAGIDAAPGGSGGALVARWVRQVEARARVTLSWTIEADVPRPESAAAVAAATARPAHLTDLATVRSDDALFDRVIARGISDLALLVTPGPGAGERLLAAGVPWFTTLIGRDAILASLAAAIVDPTLAVDTLRVLARLQAVADDPSRDAEPGKIVHEARRRDGPPGEVPWPHTGAVDDASGCPLGEVMTGRVT
jgi:glycogen debranching enzyme